MGDYAGNDGQLRFSPQAAGPCRAGQPGRAGPGRSRPTMSACLACMWEVDA